MTAPITQLWQEHEAAEFPPGVRGAEIEGTDLVLLDADIVGCVTTFLTRGGRLDLRRTAVLGLCHRDVALAARALPEPARTYYRRLERLARLTLAALAHGHATAS
jgi:hypothetical protein